MSNIEYFDIYYAPEKTINTVTSRQYLKYVLLHYLLLLLSINFEGNAAYNHLSIK